MSKPTMPEQHKKFDLNKLVMRLTGSDSFGDGQYGPPEATAFRYQLSGSKGITEVTSDADGYQVFASNNDGFELWMGWHNQWDNHLRAEEVRALFWWILFEWFGRARWFGLRRPIYYWALHRHVSQFRRVSK
jgi:hypothetical protein